MRHEPMRAQDDVEVRNAIRFDIRIENALGSRRIGIVDRDGMKPPKPFVVDRSQASVQALVHPQGCAAIEPTLPLLPPRPWAR